MVLSFIRISISCGSLDLASVVSFQSMTFARNGPKSCLTLMTASSTFITSTPRTAGVCGIGRGTSRARSPVGPGTLARYAGSAVRRRPISSNVAPVRSADKSRDSSARSRATASKRGNSSGGQWDWTRPGRRRGWSVARDRAAIRISLAEQSTTSFALLSCSTAASRLKGFSNG